MPTMCRSIAPCTAPSPHSCGSQAQEPRKKISAQMEILQKKNGQEEAAPEQPVSHKHPLQALGVQRMLLALYAVDVSQKNSHTHTKIIPLDSNNDSL